MTQGATKILGIGEGEMSPAETEATVYLQTMILQVTEAAGEFLPFHILGSAMMGAFVQLFAEKSLTSKDYATKMFSMTHAGMEEAFKRTVDLVHAMAEAEKATKQ